MGPDYQMYFINSQIMKLERKGTVRMGTILLLIAVLTGFEMSKTIHMKDYGVA